MLTEEKLLQQLQSDKSGYCFTHLYTTILKQDVRIEIYSGKEGCEVALDNYVLKSIWMFLNLDSKFIEQLLTYVWSDYLELTTDVSFGFVPDALLAKHNNDHTRANREHFGFSSAQEAFQRCEIVAAYFDRNQKIEGVETSCTLELNTPWEQEHALLLLIKDGEIAGFA